MVTYNLIDNVKFIRRWKGGVWFKTLERGWIRPEDYQFYIGYKFDPIFLKEENYDK